MSVIEGNVRLRLEDGAIETHDCNNIYLGDPDAGLDKLSKKPIAAAYRPWEEQEANLKRREELKALERERRKEMTDLHVEAHPESV